MNRVAKIEVLKALGKGKISKMEAQKLIQANGKVIVNLSSEVQSPDPIQSVLDQNQELKDHFHTIITLGNGKRPQAEF